MPARLAPSWSRARASTAAASGGRCARVADDLPGAWVGHLRIRRPRSGETHRELRAATDEFFQGGRSTFRTDRPERNALDDLGQPHTLVRTDRPLPGHADDRPRLDDRERRAALDQGRPRLLVDLARVGRERLPADVRRLPPARRAPRRPLRPAPAVPDRHHALHGRVAGLRPLDDAGPADQRRAPCRASAARSPPRSRWAS